MSCWADFFKNLNSILQLLKVSNYYICFYTQKDHKPITILPYHIQFDLYYRTCNEQWLTFGFPGHLPTCIRDANKTACFRRIDFIALQRMRPTCWTASVVCTHTNTPMHFKPDGEHTRVLRWYKLFGAALTYTAVHRRKYVAHAFQWDILRGIQYTKY